MEDFLIQVRACSPVLGRQESDFVEPEPAHGAREVTAALNDRREAMKAGIVGLKVQLSRDVPRAGLGILPRPPRSEQLLGRMDVFRIQRIFVGHPELADEADKTGVAGMLDRRRSAPVSPDEVRRRAAARTRA